MSDNTFHLTTLGDLALTAPPAAGELPAAHRQKLALLAVLALADRPLTRDALIGLFWADQEESRARHSLSNALSYLRRLLGPAAIRRHRDEVALEPVVRLTVDARQFEAAVEAEDWARAVELYRGPFLNSVFVGGSTAFEHWADGQRARLEAFFLTACEARSAQLRAAGDPGASAELARRWLAAAPLSSKAAAALLDALTAAGTRDADQRALDAYDRLATRLGEEYGRRPDREVMRRAREIVERLRASDATAEFPVPASLLGEPAEPGQPAAAARSPDQPAPPATPGTAPPRAGEPTPHRRRRWLVAAVAGAIGLAALVLLRPWHGPRSRPLSSAPAAGTPAVAVGAVRVPSDSGLAWLGDGMVQMISARLARSQAVQVVAPERMRELLPRSATLSDLLAAARRAGARWAVSGAVNRAEAGLLMDVNVHDTRDGRLAALATVSAADPITLAELAAVRVLTAAGSEPGGPSLAEVETASPDAYEHFIRYARLADEMQTEQAIAALDAAIALDSGFVSALRERASIAFPRGEMRVVEALLAAFRRHEARATEYDRLFLASQTAFYAGEHARSEMLARQLVERYPLDPRTYAWLGDVYTTHGRWQEAGETWQRLLALDSLSSRSGAGVCVPCRAHIKLAELAHLTGDLAAAERAGRRLTELVPELIASWDVYATALAAQGRYPEALAAARRGRRVDPTDIRGPSLEGRILMMARDWAGADSFVRALRSQGSPDLLPLALDLAAILARERGQYRASVALLDTLARTGAANLDLVAGTSLARLGQYEAARPRFFAVPPVRRPVEQAGLRAGSLVGDLARAFSWHRALEADAMAPSGDTTRLRAIADSLAELGGASYYGRDWRLHRHVRGLLLARQGRHEEAVAEFRAARWGHTGWTRSIAEEARSLVAQGRAGEALAELRRAYAAMLDAMGRYLTRTELDLEMARAFRAAGQADSAAVYEARVRTAWADADPEVRPLIAPAGATPPLR